jgi:type IV pilus assembly protein PilW
MNAPPLRSTIVAERPNVHRAQVQARVRRAGGFTLVELMVALVLAMLVIGIAVAVYAGTSRNRGDLERSSRLAENAHYASELLNDEIRLAGYFAEVNIVGVTWQTPDPCATDMAQLGWSGDSFMVPMFTMPVPIAGYRRGDPGPACLPNRRAGTAIVVLRRVGVEAATVASIVTHPHLQVPKCTADSLVKRWVLSAKPADFTMQNIDCKTIADARPLVIRSYYVADCNECSADTTPTLKRAELIDGEIVVTPLAEGVESLQIEYGFDANGDGNPDRFLEYPDPLLGPAYGEWSNVMAVRIYVLFRSPEAQPFYQDESKSFNLGPAGYSAAAHDGYRRVLVTSIARLNNPAGRREAP